MSGRGSVSVWDENDRDNEKSLKIGDILRGLTAREQKMGYPFGNVALGGIGRPQLVTTFIPVKRGDDFDMILDKIASHNDLSDSNPDPAMSLPGQVTFIVERRIK